MADFNALSNEIGGPATAPNVTSVIYDPSVPQVLITFDSLPGQNYKIEFSYDLTPGSWLELNDSFPSEGTTSTFTDSLIAGAAGRVYYRISVAPQ